MKTRSAAPAKWFSAADPAPGRSLPGRLQPLRTLLTALLLAGLLLTAGRAGAFGIEPDGRIRDQGGRTLVVEKPFERIISLYGAHTENLFALGLNQAIIGVGAHAVYPAEALRRPQFTYRDDPEKFLAARPDLVLIRPMIDNGYPQLVKRLEDSGIRVVSLQPNGVDELVTYWQVLGVLTGRQARAAEMIRTFEAAVAACRTLAETAGQKKRVYFEAIHSKMKTFAPGSMALFALQVAGGINIAEDARPRPGTNIAVFGKERLLSWGPFIDVYLAQVGAMNRVTTATIRDEPGFSAIKAVRDGRIYLIDEMIVSRPTLRLIDGIYEIGRILYPDRFTPDAKTAITGAAAPVGTDNENP
jgi:iron complex transport system substrate-binding protein